MSLWLNLIFLQQQGCLIRLLACIVCLLLIPDEQRLLLVFWAPAMGSTRARLHDDCLGHQVKCRWTGLLPADFCNFNTNGLVFEVLPCCCRGLKASAPSVIVMWQFTLSSSKKKKASQKSIHSRERAETSTTVVLQYFLCLEVLQQEKKSQWKKQA